MSSTTFSRWKIDNLKRVCDSNKQLQSKVFRLKDCPASEFALFLQGINYDRIPIYNATFLLGVVAMNVSGVDQTKFCVKMWLEDPNLGKFSVQTVEDFEFKTAGTKCNLVLTGLDKNVFLNIYGRKGRLHLCCEIKGDKSPLPPTAISNPLTTKPSSSPLSQRMWKLYQEQQECDASILVEGKTFKIHRSVFAAYSDAFKFMFSSNFIEGLDKEVKIEDCSAPAMGAFIRWIYLGKIENQAVIEELYYLGHKYMIEDLKAQCTWIMLRNTNEENAARRLAFAATYEINELGEQILIFIKNLDAKKIYQIFQSAEWRDFLNSKQT